MPNEPTVEEVREPFVSGEIETCRRLLEWWTDLAKIGGRHEISAGEIKRAAQFCQFYLEATATPQMSAGEFAGLVVKQLEKRILIWNRGAAELEGNAAKRCQTRSEILRGDGIHAVEFVAREHNIEIVRTDQC